MTTTSEAVNHLFDRMNADLSGAVFKDVVDSLMWLSEPLGTELYEVLQEWVESDDERRVEAALAQTTTFLYRDRQQLADRLEIVTSRWPHMAARAADVLRGWDHAHRNET